MRESRVLCLKNMVGSDELDDQLQEEIEEECSKYGDVHNVLIYQERQSEDEDAEIVVKIFVEFGQASHAKVGRQSWREKLIISYFCPITEGKRQFAWKILWRPYYSSDSL